METFLKLHRASTNTKATHTSIIPAGSYVIPTNKLDEFYQLYREALKEGKDLFLTERPEVFGSPLKLDFDIKNNVPQRKYDPEIQVIEIVKHWLKEIYKILKPKANELSSFEVILFEKEKPNETKNKNEYKDGFHLLIPKIVAPYKAQHHIRGKLIKKQAIVKLFQEIAQNPIEDIIDESVIQRNNWNLYLSKSKPAPYGGTYQITGVFKVLQWNSNTFLPLFGSDQIKFKDIFGTTKGWEIVKYLSIRNKPLSVEYISEEIRNQIEGVETPQMGLPEATPPTYEEAINMDTITTLVAMLSPKRAESYATWLEVGWCLSNISPRLFDLWLEFSKKCPAKFNKAGNIELAQKEWDRAVKKQAQMAPDKRLLKRGSLYYWAKQDSPEAYREFLNKQAFDKFERSSIGDVDIAHLVKYLYPFEFVFVPNHTGSTGGKWYYFSGHHWLAERRGSQLREIINIELYGHFIRIKDKYLRMAQELPEGQEIKKDTYRAYASKMLDVAKSLKGTTRLNKIITECEYLYKNEAFDNILDRNPNLFSFPNGIFDGITFRNGKPDDYVSLKAGVPYVPINELDSLLVKQVERFYEQILPNANIRHYYLKLQASTLDDFNREEKFHILTGEGRNGKSKSNQLLAEVLGDYACSLAIQLITQKRGDAGRASPEIAKMDKKRYGYFKEIDGMSEKVLNVGVIKDLTGNDVISCRRLYQDDNEFKVTTLLILMTNTLPDVSCDDNATWERIRVIHFPVKFCDNPDPNNPLEQKIDRDLSEKLESWKAPFLSLLVNKYYPLYRNEGLKAPDEVLKETEKYRIQNNIFLEFFNDKFKKSNKDNLTIEIIYNVFRQWFPNNYPHRAVYPKKDLIQALNKKYKKEFKNNKVLQGYTLGDEIEVAGEEGDELT